MATGPAFDHAVSLARENPSLDIGVHLVLVGAEGYPPTLARLTAAVMLGQIRIYDRLAGQVRKILDAGIRPTHLDTHKHTHLLPQVLSAVARIAQEFRIPWVRRLIPAPVPFLQSMGQAMLQRAGCRTTDYFEGFEVTGQYNTQDLAALIRRLPDGLTEFMCHPGFCGEELRAAKTRLKASRQVELDALTSIEVRNAIEECSVALVRYPDLS